MTDFDQVRQWNNAAMFVTVKNILMYDAGQQQQKQSDDK